MNPNKLDNLSSKKTFRILIQLSFINAENKRARDFSDCLGHKKQIQLPKEILTNFKKISKSYLESSKFLNGHQIKGATK